MFDDDDDDDDHVKRKWYVDHSRWQNLTAYAKKNSRNTRHTISQT